MQTQLVPFLHLIPSLSIGHWEDEVQISLDFNGAGTLELVETPVAAPMQRLLIMTHRRVR